MRQAGGVAPPSQTELFHIKNASTKATTGGGTRVSRAFKPCIGRASYQSTRLRPAVKVVRLTL